MLWRHPAVRLLLLVLAFGVAGMHTLGHHEGHDTSSSMSGHAVHDEAAASDAVTVTPPTGDMNPSQMCLAVLTAGAALALALFAARTRQRVPASRWRPKLRASRRSSRGPPRSVPVSLLTAQVTVLRI